MTATGNGHPPRTAIRTCPLCEATCGLELTLAGDEVVAIRGDREDVFSHGFICPKGYALKELHADPDRVRTPLVRRPDGTFREVSWGEAFALIDERLPPILAADRNAVALYLGNPNAHVLDSLLYVRALAKMLGTRNLYSASTVDQFPKQMASALMFGTGTTVAVPDLDRTDHLLLLGANPLASNGSLMTAPDVRGRLRALRARGGKLVVIDPRRSRTAEEADEHHFIRPGTDAHLLFALVHVLFEEGLADPGERLTDMSDGLDEVRELATPFTPEDVAEVCGIPAADIRRIARELAAAPAAAVYGRIGTTTQEYGTLASWLVDVLNVLTGNLDREGGAMFPLGAAGHSNAAGTPGRGRGARFGRWTSRVRELGEVFGELPVACLSEEIDTPGEGQVRALITVAGNPVAVDPEQRAARRRARLARVHGLARHLRQRDHQARRRDPPLPFAASPLALRPGAVPVRGPQRGQLLAADAAARARSSGRVGHAAAPRRGRRRDGPGRRRGDARRADRPGADRPRGRHSGVARRRPGGRRAARRATAASRSRAAARLHAPDRPLPRCRCADLEAAPHGIDLGPLQPRLPDALRTASGKIELAPAPIVADVERLRASLSAPRPGGDGELVLIGRRQLRSNNSWMHNLPVLVRGKPRCTLHVHPADAERLALRDGEPAELRSRTGTVVAPVEVTDAIMPGVVSLPHGWGHDADGSRLAVAAGQPGTNSNILADELLLDPLSGNAVLNGIPVSLAPVAAVV